MHHCLRVPEIFQLICEELHDDNHIRRDSALFYLALTCRDLRDHSLAKLWETIHHNIDPIIKCAGRDLWTIEEHHRRPTSYKMMHLTRPLSASDISTIKKYAPFVRHIQKCNSSHQSLVAQLSPTVWEALSIAFEGTILFSNVKNLYSYDPHLVLPPLINAQKLTSITARMVNLPCKWTPFTRYPNLTSINLEENLYTAFDNLQQISTVAMALHDAIPNWPRLARYNSPYGVFATLEALSCHSSSLQRLRMEIFLAPLIGASLEPDSVTFPCLETIDIGFVRFWHSQQLMHSLVAIDTLRSLTIRLPFPEDNTDISCWLSQLQSLSKHSHSLKKVVIRELLNHYRRYDDFEGEIVPDTTVTALPLTSFVLFAIADYFSTLTHIEIYVVAGYDINDEDMDALTKSLPLVEKYRLYSDKESRRSPKITLQCLSSFANNCKSLTDLALSFDAAGPAQRTGMDKSLGDVSYLESSSPGSELKNLDVCSSPIQNPELVTSFLSKTFPNLQSLDFDNHTLWSDVCRLLSL